MKEKCWGSVRKNTSFYRTRPCINPIRVERDGKFYCGIHDPEGKAAKVREARSQMAQEKYDAERARSRRDRNRLAVFDEMLGALKEAVECIEYCRREHSDPQHGTGFPVEVFWRELIAKAKGESNA